MDMTLSVRWHGWWTVGCRTHSPLLLKSECSLWAAESLLFRAYEAAPLEEEVDFKMGQSTPIATTTTEPGVDVLLRAQTGSADISWQENAFELIADSGMIQFCLGGLGVDLLDSHDLERALCRFWLRGTCAKQESCEFLHHLPKDADVSNLNLAMSRATIQPSNGVHSPPPDEFPALGFENTGGRGRRGSGYPARAYNDPGRTRFAAAVKKPPPAHVPPSATDSAIAARREAAGLTADNLHHRSAIVAPRPSPRLKLRPPQLLPTLPTGEAINSMYMSYRARAIQLGAARNACLSRAADAWRRGDGAAAKRFSREGHEMNAKMAGEMAGAAAGLVKERAKVAEQAVRGRDAAWSDDPGDRGARGSSCGGGYGVVLGVAGRDVGDGKLTAEERMECVLDLHGLHSNEATEVLEQFLLAVSGFCGLFFSFWLSVIVA